MTDSTRQLNEVTGLFVSPCLSVIGAFHNFIFTKERSRSRKEDAVVFLLFWCFSEDRAFHRDGLEAQAVFTCKQDFQNGPCLVWV